MQYRYTTNMHSLDIGIDSCISDVKHIFLRSVLFFIGLGLRPLIAALNYGSEANERDAGEKGDRHFPENAATRREPPLPFFDTGSSWHYKNSIKRNRASTKASCLIIVQDFCNCSPALHLRMNRHGLTRRKPGNMPANTSRAGRWALLPGCAIMLLTPVDDYNLLMTIQIKRLSAARQQDEILT